MDHSFHLVSLCHNVLYTQCTCIQYVLSISGVCHQLVCHHLCVITLCVINLCVITLHVITLNVISLYVIKMPPQKPTRQIDRQTWTTGKVRAGLRSTQNSLLYTVHFYQNFLCVSVCQNHMYMFIFSVFSCVCV